MWKGLIVLLLAVVLYFLFWPVPIDPVAWEAPEAPALEGPYATNNKLSAVTWYARDFGVGPEDVAVDEAGWLYVGYEDGRIVRFDAQGQHPREMVNTGGRPLGLDFDPAGNLIIADGYKGLLLMAPDGDLSVLTTSANGLAFGFTDDVDVAEDGMIYFSDASSKFGPAEKARDDILEHGGHGRLLRYDLNNGTTTVLLDGLQFANGVAVSPDGESVLVAQTGSYNILRYWLKGEKAETYEVFFENLPGIPDGMSCNGRDTYWVALYAPRNALLDALSGYPFLRKMSWRLPEIIQPQPAAHAFILGLGPDGTVTHNLQHKGPDSYHPITSVEQAGGKLFLGSLIQPAFASLPLPSLSSVNKN
ncbi:MAG: SMP-30/gluconolactonase/LRE family protein [Thermodesulfobacteriota bacterium]|nr:SMP-30/gluconolactonase/LRE family protein [Thermodesulfobacteriota bacterium]